MSCARIGHIRLGKQSHLVSFGSHHVILNPCESIPPVHTLQRVSGILITSIESFTHLIEYLPHLPDEACVVTTQPVYDLGMFYLRQRDAWSGTHTTHKVQHLLRVAGARLHTAPRASTIQLKCLAFREKFFLNQHDICVQPLPSGHTLGSPNFLISLASFDVSIAYISSSSAIQNRYTAQLDYEAFSHCNVVLVDSVNTSPMLSSPGPASQTPSNTLLTSTNSHAQMYDLFTKTMGMALSNGGSVFIPVHATGIIYDLLDLVRVYLISLNMQSNVNIYFISPMADASLKYANVSAEYLTESKQNKALYTNEQPFDHEMLIQSNQLMVFDEADSNFANVFHAKRALPSIIFAGDPSLTHGDAKSIVRILERDPKNLILMVEPDVDPVTAAAPYKKLNPKLNVKHTPIDLRLNPESVATLLRIMKPENVICCSDVIPFIQQYNLIQSKTTGGSPTYNLFSSPAHADSSKSLLDCTINIVLKRKFVRAQIEHNLTRTIHSRAIGEQRVARVVGQLKRTDGQHVLSRANKRRRLMNNVSDDEDHDDNSFLLVGTANIKQLLEQLYRNGVNDVQVFTGEAHGLPFGHYKIVLSELDASIQFSAEGTTIESRSE
eukprot:CAMPEP_0117450604 /NCGR_PEP_ID=MMETSP0759-20121206/8557_1 /TAXON_ID=63605 /ORGANISM="Percolomonas cosmopolitus, Strain WS" /LENGTH=607 /DNA_ID=CAMNT_0005243137 /DNA_START=65 /DNA_END=1885 /DNA_ORIENTATION=-